MNDGSTALIRALNVPARVLITGASSGIGLALVGRLLENPAVASVVAVSRRAEQAPAITQLVREHGARLVPLSIDITDESALMRLAEQLRGPLATLNLVVNAAGILHDTQLRPEKTIAQVRPTALARVFALNAFAPILLARALLPHLRHDEPSVLTSLSARVGSITDNALGGWYAYRASKAAQNQLYRTLAIELRRSHPRTICTLLHPGTVDTPLSRPFRSQVPAQRLFTPRRAAEQLLHVIAGLTAADSGRFLAWDGSEIPW